MPALDPEESDLVDAILSVVAKHGKFNEDATGVWAGYTPAAENEVASIGVKCSNCVFYRGGTECAVITAEVEPDGKCRFAAIPDGVVKMPEENVEVEEYFDMDQQEMHPDVKARAEEEPPYDKYEMDLEDLAPTQSTVNLRRVIDVYDSDKPIKVWLTSTGPRIIDGHHRAVAHMMQGKQTIPVETYSYTDNDLLPASHRRSTKKEASMEAVTASALQLRARALSARVALVAAAPAEPVLGPDGKPLTDEQNLINGKPVKTEKAFDGFNESRLNAKSQIRDDRGKFRKVLARLKHNLGESGLQAVTDKLQLAQDMDFAGNYKAANRAAGKLIGLVDRIDTGALDSKSLENVRATAGELGKVIANTPLPFGSENEKLSFSDLPPSMKTLAKDMMDRVLEKLGPKDGAQAVQKIKSFMSGADQLSQAEVQSEFSVLLRLLT
jgi:ParB-like chromosome segregation protein Spo0J